MNTDELYKQLKLGRRLDFIKERKALVFVMPLISLKDGGVGVESQFKSIIGMESVFL